MRTKLTLILIIFLSSALLCNCSPLSGTTDDLTYPQSTPDVTYDASATDSITADPLNDVKLLFINVGKADALLIQCAQKNYLVDTGEKESITALLGALAYMNVDTLDGVFLTHTHSDHIGGFTALSNNCEISALYCAEITELTKKGNNRFEQLSNDTGVPLYKLTAGNEIELADGVSVTAIAPLEYNADDDNDNSLVLKLAANGRTVLLTGDMQFDEEKTLLLANTDLKADILKVGNHGNPDATSDLFAKAVSAQIAVISTDTAIDSDSANMRVRACLSGAKVYVTEDFPLGVLISINSNGAIDVSSPSVDASALSLTIEKPNAAAQTVSIKNNGEKSDISGCMIYSTRGGEVFVFPQNTYIEAGGSITVACEGSSGNYIWYGENKAWHTKKEDDALLFDKYGTKIS